MRRADPLPRLTGMIEEAFDEAALEASEPRTQATWGTYARRAIKSLENAKNLYATPDGKKHLKEAEDFLTTAIGGSYGFSDKINEHLTVARDMARLVRDGWGRRNIDWAIEEIMDALRLE